MEQHLQAINSSSQVNTTEGSTSTSTRPVQGICSSIENTSSVLGLVGFPLNLESHCFSALHNLSVFLPLIFFSLLHYNHLMIDL